MTSSARTLSRLLAETEFQPLGKRNRRTVSYKEPTLDDDEEDLSPRSRSPSSKRQKRKAPAPPKRGKAPAKKGGSGGKAKAGRRTPRLAFCESDDSSDDGLLSEGEESDREGHQSANAASDAESSEDVLLELSSDGDSSDPSVHEDEGSDVESEEESDAMEEDDPRDSDDSASDSERPRPKEADPGPTIDKLLSTRRGEDGEEYLIKWKNQSYWHVEWMPRATLEDFTGGKTRIRCYRPTEFETFDPQLAQIDRIIDHDGEGNYLCKWCVLGYDEATWESEEDIRVHEEEFKIDEYLERETLPPKKQLNAFKRPRPREFDVNSVEIPEFKGERALHDYQEDGLRWLICCWYAQRSSILADEMGLGKTIQSVAILEYLNSVKGNRGPFLVVAPVSTLEQWRREVETWTDLNCVLYHGSATSRAIIQEKEWRFQGASKYKQLFKFQVLLTSYQTVINDLSVLSKIRWQYVIVDEGHRLKNTKSKLFESLQSYHTEHRLVLTGTPLQNNIQELWAILHYVDPDKFFSLEDFEAHYGNLNNKQHRKKLHKILSAYLLRRLKEDVFKELPIKEETIIETELTAIQKRFYKAILDRNRDFLCKGVKSSNVPSLINIMVELRKCCNHPFLINGAEEKIVGNLDKARDLLLEALINSSAKLIILDKLLSKLRSEGHQVLIFSQMTQLLNILEDYLTARNYPYERLDGSVSLNDRQASIDRFSNKSHDNFVFLLSTRAGGLGLNLTAANTAVIFDSDWNPQNDLQAQARCHRIGQTENVKIYRLVTKNTYEEYMLSVASRKLGLEMVVLSSDDNDSVHVGGGGAKSLDKKEVDHLLKYGAYHLFNSSEEEDQDEEKKLLSEDINSILGRATTVKYDEKPEDSEKAQPLGNLSKVTYQIDLDDENFWESVLPEHKTAKMLLKQLKANDDNEFSQPQVRTVFLEDLRSCIEDLQETLDARSKSFAFSSQAPVIAASNLIDAVTTSEWFSEEEKLPLFALQSSIISTKRERKTVDRTMAVDGLPPNAETKKQTKKERQAAANEAAAAEARKEAELKKEMDWSKQLRDKVKNALVALGPGRWKEIAAQVFPKEERKSKSTKQLRALCECIIQQYFGREDLGAHPLVTTKKDDKPPSKDTTFYGRWIQTESEQIALQLVSHYRRLKLKHTPAMRSDWDRVRIQLGSEESMELQRKVQEERNVQSAEKEEDGDFKMNESKPPPKKAKALKAKPVDASDAPPAADGAMDDDPTAEETEDGDDSPPGDDASLVRYDPGQTVTLHFENLPEGESFTPVFVLLRLVKDDKKEGRNCIVQAYEMDTPSSALDVVIPGYVGEYRVQLWSPLWTKSPSSNSKLSPHTRLMVQCPEVLEPVTRFAVQRWVGQCEFMRSLEKVLQIKPTAHIKPGTKSPAWWWNIRRDDDLAIMKGVWKHGYGHFTAIRSDPEFPFDDEALRATFMPLWKEKLPQEKARLGYCDPEEAEPKIRPAVGAAAASPAGEGSSGSAPAPAVPAVAAAAASGSSSSAATPAAGAGKKKLKDNPFEFPSTTTLNNHLKAFLKVNLQEGDNEKRTADRAAKTTGTAKSSSTKPSASKAAPKATTKPAAKATGTAKSSSAKPSAKDTKGTATTKSAPAPKRKAPAKKVATAKRDASPETFVKKRTKKTVVRKKKVVMPPLLGSKSPATPSERKS